MFYMNVIYTQKKQLFEISKNLARCR